MPYQPTVADQGPSFLAAGIANAGNAVAQGIQQYQQNQAQTANMQGKLEQMHQMDPNMVTSDMLAKFSAGNLNAKREVFSMADLAMTQRQIDAQRAMQQQGINIQMLRANNEAAAQNAGLAMQKETLDRLHPEGGVQSTVTPLVDPVTGQTFGYSVPTSPGQNQVIPNTPKLQPVDPNQGPLVKKVGDTTFYFDHQNGGWKPVAPPNWMNGLMNGGAAGGAAPGVTVNIPSGDAAQAQAPAAQPPAATGGGAQGTAKTLNPADQAALQWAQANPNDPRAKQIVSKLTAQ